jgi:hypothetical protein
MTTEIVVSTDDLTVLAPPDTIELLLDFGPTGQRGSQIFSGIGEPADFTSGGQIFGQDLYLNDYYINAAPGSDYSYLYQYRTGAGGSANAWFKLIKINPTIYSAINDVYFTNGDGTIEIPISNITSISAASLSASNFSVQYNLVNSNPIASSISSISISGTDLVIDLKAAEFDGSSWSNLDSGVSPIPFSAHMFITVVI